METSPARNTGRDAVLRMIAVACVTAGFGLLFFRFSIFNMRMIASQFFTSGVTAGIFYAALKAGRWRDGLAVLLVWYLVMVFLLTRYNPWLLVLSFAYIAGIAAAVWVYHYFVRREFVRGMIQRLAAAGVITAIANALIVVFLGLWSVHAVLASPGYFASVVFRNLQLGTMIGIGFGIGVEIVEFALMKMSGVARPAQGTPSAPGSPSHHESTLQHRETIVVTCTSCGRELELTPAEVAAEAYTCPSCGKPGTL
jgi:hypothetical protein